ncbi:Cytidine and dCMP deaminase domain-containing protein 1 [Desmophyllum pertusum]|uniref:Cytidine and dCMP deaminase domain-containing protein 1 n=1 Tax=Desmophyllum pertusum TaxID=174260 RepID=A0A9X0A215_9CNID|nr:Cytidine and dCMP deaminase domain-containing protein 1 [Desmophyllum pertusum]
MASENTESSTSSQGIKPTYTDRDSRISKDNLSMVLALWMEQFPVRDDVGEQEADPYRKIGAVLVLPNDMLHAVDCTRDGVHGVARLLLKHSVMSLKTLLVQCKVKRVFYLPIEPEYKDVEEFKDETCRVDNLFKTSAISQSVFVPTVGSDVFANAEKKKETPQETREDITGELLGSYWNEGWMEKAKDDLPWPAFDDNMKTQVRGDFKNIMEWMARILIEERKGYKFKALARNQATIPFDLNPPQLAVCHCQT